MCSASQSGRERERERELLVACHNMAPVWPGRKLVYCRSQCSCVLLLLALVHCPSRPGECGLAVAQVSSCNGRLVSSEVLTLHQQPPMEVASSCRAPGIGKPRPPSPGPTEMNTKPTGSCSAGDTLGKVHKTTTTRTAEELHLLNYNAPRNKYCTCLFASLFVGAVRVTGVRLSG